MLGNATPDPSGVGTIFSGSMKVGNCAIRRACESFIDDELSTMNRTSTLFSNDAGNSSLVLPCGSATGGTNGWGLHAPISGNDSAVEITLKIFIENRPFTGNPAA